MIFFAGRNAEPSFLIGSPPTLPALDYTTGIVVGYIYKQVNGQGHATEKNPPKAMSASKVDLIPRHPFFVGVDQFHFMEFSPSGAPVCTEALSPLSSCMLCVLQLTIFSFPFASFNRSLC